MNLLVPSVKILDELDGEIILAKLETCGRTCYKSEGKKSSILPASKFMEAL
jgi:hypothetical protein